MRIRILIPVLALGLLAVLLALLLRPHSIGSAADQPTLATSRDRNRAAPAQPTTAARPPTGNAASSVPGGEVLSPEPASGPASIESKQQAYVEARTLELQSLAMNDDSASLQSILEELNNRDPQIRQAALEAVVQFGSRDAIPRLQDAASQTEDPHEKAALADAIEFLKLPSLTEVLAQRNGEPARVKTGKGRE